LHERKRLVTGPRRRRHYLTGQARAAALSIRRHVILSSLASSPERLASRLSAL